MASPLPAMQQVRTETPDDPPAPGFLRPGQFSVEMASTPPKLWVGVPTTIDPTGRVLLVPPPGIAGGATVSETPPPNPSQGDLWFASDIGQLFCWYEDATSAQWVIANSGGGAAGGASVTISDTPPANASAGDLWWNSVSGELYVWYVDANSSQWVIANSGGGGAPAPGGPAMGVTDGNWALPGEVGEILSSFNTFTPADFDATGTSMTDVTMNVPIPPGDWDIWFSVLYRMSWYSSGPVPLTSSGIIQAYLDTPPQSDGLSSPPSLLFTMCPFMAAPGSATQNNVGMGQIVAGMKVTTSAPWTPLVVAQIISAFGWPQPSTATTNNSVVIMSARRMR